MNQLYFQAVPARRASAIDTRASIGYFGLRISDCGLKSSAIRNRFSGPRPSTLDSRPLHAFTLLEIILALAILAGALAALGEVMRLADQTAGMTESETQAQILAASLIDELASGARQLSAVSQSPLDSSADPPWVFSIAIENTNFQELVAVRVLVEQQLDTRLQPARFELTRWMTNPDYVPEETSSTEGSTNASSSSKTTGGSSGGSSSTSGGSQP